MTMTREDLINKITEAISDGSGLPVCRLLRNGAERALSIIEEEFRNRALRETPEHSLPFGDLGA